MEEEFETLLVITQRDSTTVLQPLPTSPHLQLSVTTGFPGPKGADGNPGPPGAPGDGSPEAYDPGDLTLYFQNGLI